MKQVLRDIDQQQLEEQGYMIIRKGLNAAQIQACREGWEKHQKDHQDIPITMLMSDHHIRQEVHDTIVSCMEDCINKYLINYEIIMGTFLLKNPNSGPLNPHQDPSFIDEQNNLGLIVWTPLVPTDAQNGTLNVFPGSHKLNDNPRSLSALPYRDLIDVINKELMVSIEMQPGDLLVMDGRLIHGSGDNFTNQPRAAISCITVPKYADVMYFYNNTQTNADEVEVYNMPRDFMLRQLFLQPPTEGSLIRKQAHKVTQHTAESIRGQFIN